MTAPMARVFPEPMASRFFVPSADAIPPGPPVVPLLKLVVYLPGRPAARTHGLPSLRPNRRRGRPRLPSLRRRVRQAADGRAAAQASIRDRGASPGWRVAPLVDPAGGRHGGGRRLRRPAPSHSPPPTQPPAVFRPSGRRRVPGGATPAP